MAAADSTDEPPNFMINVRGGQPISKVAIVRDNAYVYNGEPGKTDFHAGYRDMGAKPGETHYYYVRVQQSDGNLAWASPMWITYQP